MTEALHQQTLPQLRAALQAGQLSATELAQHFLQRIQAHADLGAFLATDEAVTLAQARAADARLSQGDATVLTGIPVAHKDLLVTREFPTTAGSRMLTGYRSPFDATVVQRLGAAGMVCLGKLNCDEFGMGSGNENSAFGPVHNPWDPSRVAGGSSGGSAAAVAAGLAPASTATDTGGSIRQPAGFCGLTAIRPTYGRVSRHGMVAHASSLDQAGPMARSAEGCAWLLSAMAGPDTEHDATSLDRPAEDYAQGLDRPLEGLRIGVPHGFFGAGLSADVGAALEAALALLEKQGARRVDVALPRADLAVATYYVLATAEASSNLARYDGVRYGHRTPDPADLDALYEKSRSEGFGTEVKRRILTGTHVSGHGCFDAYYVKAQKVRRLIAQDLQEALRHCDVIAAPVAPTVAWPLGAPERSALDDYLADVYTIPASLAGLPAMSVPAGFGAGGLPVGLQLIGNYLQEGRLLNIAHQFQQHSDFHRQHAKGF
ncbi:MAG: Asp-tRNA(Asn)/Glu-tRNA(Gln) amidotransferase subunit GatA [Ottowia sp.]|nr:Asp-tRNA(Asn)/Glu-tRNA(Gln) amidotransferase subunit GatA [Ottowia sp.]